MWKQEEKRQVPNLTGKRGSVGQSEGLLIPRLSVRFRLKLKTQTHMDLSYIDPQLRVLNYGWRLLKMIKATIIILAKWQNKTTNR